MKISKIMGKVVVSEEDISLKKALEIIEKKDADCLVVLKKDKILGIITEKDIAKNIGQPNKKVSDAMSKNVITIDSEDSVESAANLMKKNKIRHLPVVDDKEFLVGVVTAEDIVEHADELGEDFIFE